MSAEAPAAHPEGHPEGHPHHHHHHHHEHHGYTEHHDWTQGPGCWAFKNMHTGAYLSTHDDGKIVCEDQDLMHHGIPFHVHPAAAGHGIQIQFAINSHYLTISPEHAIMSVPALPEHGWETHESNGHFSFFCVASKSYLAVDGTNIVASPHKNEKCEWQVAPIAAPPVHK